MDFDPGPDEFILTPTTEIAFIVKLNANGEFQWAKSPKKSDVWTGSGITSASNIIIGENQNIIISGDFYGVIDFDPGNGEFELAAQSYYWNYFLCLDQNGDFL